jgi:hypothetical protein
MRLIASAKKATPPDTPPTVAPADDVFVASGPAMPLVTAVPEVEFVGEGVVLGLVGL